MDNTPDIPADDPNVLDDVEYILYHASGGKRFIKTLGKVFTNTRAINDDGSRISPKTAFLRCFSRFVPFEAFSALGNPSYPWHDRWTHTMVIDEKLTTLPPAE